MLSVIINGESFRASTMDGLMTQLDTFCHKTPMRRLTYYVDTKNFRIQILCDDAIIWDVPIIDRTHVMSKDEYNAWRQARPFMARILLFGRVTELSFHSLLERESLIEQLGLDNPVFELKTYLRTLD